MQLEINFEGFWQCRLATDPDPSDEQKGISGFTYSIAGESLLEPSFWSQATDIEKTYGVKDEAFMDPLFNEPWLKIKNLREASPDYKSYNEKGIGINVTGVSVVGLGDEQKQIQLSSEIEQKLKGGLVRFEKRAHLDEKKWPWKGPIFEGRNQITSDGDPDRFTLNPFVISISDPSDSKVILKRFDPLDFKDPDKPLWKINPSDDHFEEILERRLPKQRFAMSKELLNQVGIDPDELSDHFVNRASWLKAKVMEAEAAGKTALAEAYKSRLFAVDFFTKSTGPTVFENRLLSRIPLRQLYQHTIRGDETMQPAPFCDQSFFEGITIDLSKEWEILYYLGAYDGDLMCGWSTGTLSIPVKLM